MMLKSNVFLKNVIMKNTNNSMKKIFIFISLIGISCSLIGQNSSVYEYDQLNRLIKIIKPNNNIVEYYYDEVGNRTLKIGASTKSLTIQVLVEGLFNSQSSTLNKVQNGSGDAFPGNIADSISIELHRNTYPYDQIGNTYNAALMTNGNATTNLPTSLNSEYYIVVKHRNSIETWSAYPISLNTGNTTYDFTLSSSQAFGSNLKAINGKYCIYAGDVNQDGIVDTSDMTFVENDASNFVTGYIETDINGDGSIDIGDMIIIDNNSSLFIVRVTP